MKINTEKLKLELKVERIRLEKEYDKIAENRRNQEDILMPINESLRRIKIRQRLIDDTLVELEHLEQHYKQLE